MSIDRDTAPMLDRLRRARGQQESVIRWLQVLAPVVLVLFVASAALTPPRFGLSGRPLLVVIAVIAFLVGVLGRNATRVRPRPLHLTFVALLVGSSTVLMSVQPQGPGAEGMLLGVLCIAVLVPHRVAIPLLVSAFVAIELIAAVTDAGYVTLAMLAALGALYGMLFLSRRLTDANRQAEQLLAELRASRTAEARAAGLAERQRLAREMHDVLAHSLSGLMLQLEGARMLAADDPSDPRLPGAIERAHHLGRQGLDEARRAIGMLRDDELPGPERLTALADQFQQDLGIPCRVVVSGDPCELGSEARVAVYRVAQEALTNITKHARPSRVELRLAYEQQGARLTVEDFGAAAPEPPPKVGSGYGLTGMRERAELLGGTLTTAVTGGGFRVDLDVPR